MIFWWLVTCTVWTKSTAQNARFVEFRMQYTIERCTNIQFNFLQLTQIRIITRFNHRKKSLRKRKSLVVRGLTSPWNLMDSLRTPQQLIVSFLFYSFICFSKNDMHTYIRYAQCALHIYIRYAHIHMHYLKMETYSVYWQDNIVYLSVYVSIATQRRESSRD